jgi:L-amino acid N-acyltransferase YncA
MPVTGLAIRRATLEDAAQIGVIYDEAIAGDAATFATGPHHEDERRGWLAGRAATAPVFVGEDAGHLVAWSALAPFSHRSWYSGVGEYTVYVAGAARGRGVGRAMLDHLIIEAPAFGYWKLVGLIFPENAAGLALAQGAGFGIVGRLEAHGRLAGAWRDIMLLERRLEAGSRGRDGD